VSTVWEVVVAWMSQYQPVEVGGTTLHELILDTASRFGDRPALVDGSSGMTVSYRVLAAPVELDPGTAVGLLPTPAARPGCPRG
jgi:hypothetical protein